MAQRSRKRRGGKPAAKAPAAAAPAEPPRDTMRRGYARSRQRDEAVRARLKPYGPGERPLVVTICAVLAAAIAVANFALYLAGWDVRGQDPNLGGALALCVVFLAAAAGMWRMRYWAVLGFEVLLGVLMASAAFSLLLASNLQGALLSLAVLAICGPLFWLLVRVMARLQMPERHRPQA